MRQSIQMFVDAFAGVELPVLERPMKLTNSQTSKARAVFQLKRFSYASLSYVRDLVEGLRVLDLAGNTAGVDLVVRSAYEWTMQASYVAERATPLMATESYGAVDELLDSLFGGNSWVKRHGTKYYQPDVEGLEDWIPNAIRIKHYQKAFKEYQLRIMGEENTDDDYGYLSVLAHPNSFCLLKFVEETPNTVRFLRPVSSRVNRGIVMATMIMWCLCIIDVLRLTDETHLQPRIVSLLKRLAKAQETT